MNEEVKHEKKLQATALFLLTSIKRQVQTFLGLMGHYRCYILNYGSIAAPLTSLTRKLVLVSVSLGVEGSRSFSKLKEVL